MNSQRDATAARWSPQRAATSASMALAAALVTLLAATGTVQASETRETKAQGVPAYEVKRHLIAAGGGVSSGSDYVIRGSIGQHDADPLQPSSGGVYAITGGYWSAAAPLDSDTIFADGFEDVASANAIAIPVP